MLRNWLTFKIVERRQLYQLKEYGRCAGSGRPGLIANQKVLNRGIRVRIPDLPPIKDDNMKIKPLSNYLVIEKIDDRLVSPGGIKLIRIDKTQACIAKVLAVGPGFLDEKENFRTCGVEVGDTIAYLRPEAKTFKIDNENITMLRGSGVLGKLK